MVIDGIIVKKVRNKGRGLFVTTPISKGTVVLKFEGEVVKDSEIGIDEAKDHFLPYGKGINLRIGEPENLINHSCNPNVGFRDKQTLFAIRNIEIGEELAFDYSTIGADGWEMHCSCGEPNCRKTIKDYKYLTNKLKEKYKSITPDWVKDLQK